MPYLALIQPFGELYNVNHIYQLIISENIIYYELSIYIIIRYIDSTKISKEIYNKFNEKFELAKNKIKLDYQFSNNEYIITNINEAIELFNNLHNSIRIIKSNKSEIYSYK